MGRAAEKNGEEPRNCTGVSHETSTKLHEINWVLMQKKYIIMGSIISVTELGLLSKTEWKENR